MVQGIEILENVVRFLAHANRLVGWPQRAIYLPLWLSGSYQRVLSNAPMI